MYYEYARTTENQWRRSFRSFDKYGCGRFNWENYFICLINKNGSMKDLTADEKKQISGGMILEPIGLRFIQAVLDMLK